MLPPLQSVVIKYRGRLQNCTNQVHFLYYILFNVFCDTSINKIVLHHAVPFFFCLIIIENLCAATSPVILAIFNCILLRTVFFSFNVVYISKWYTYKNWIITDRWPVFYRWLHLGFNLVVQLLVGLPLEMVHGSGRVAFIYMAGVAAGSLGTSVFDTDVYLVGASGGVYALLAAHLANVLLNYNNMQFGILRLFGIFVIGMFINFWRPIID